MASVGAWLASRLQDAAIRVTLLASDMPAGDHLDISLPAGGK
jgi:hypothetical protein